MSSLLSIGDQNMLNMRIIDNQEEFKMSNSILLDNKSNKNMMQSMMEKKFVSMIGQNYKARLVKESFTDKYQAEPEELFTK